MIGQKLSHYRITAKLGEGGMGQVYLAEDTRLGRDVAIKVLPEHLAHDPDRLARFQREAESLAAINHPNIISIYSIEEEGSLRFLVMERVEGETLGEVIPAEGLAVDRFFDLAIPIADALAAAHTQGIVHRDLKPANVMVSADGVAKVLDLGLAKLQPDEVVDEEAPTQTASPTALGVVMGTSGYMSPEQAEGRPIGPASDVFSLGVLYYEMLSGTNPFRRETVASSLAAILHERPGPIRHHGKPLPRDLQAALDRCLAKSPDERHPSAASLRDDLRASRDRLQRRSTGWQAIVRKPAVAGLLVAAAILAVVATVHYVRGAADRRWARQEALPEIERLVAEGWRDHTDAYELAVEAERFLPGDPRLAQLLEETSLRVSVTTEPPGAEVSVKGYSVPDNEWTPLGTTPLEGARLPISVLRWRFEKPGYEAVDAVVSTWALGGGEFIGANTVHRVLDEAGAVPENMSRVAGAATSVGSLEDFFIDRLEVTNGEFQQFVDAGGYRRPEYWKHPIVEDGEELAWEEAIGRFVDRTDRPGPSTWEAGTHPEGRSNYPVNGVSWYEAAAYAEFVGKTLPTSHHWGLARGGAEQVIMWPQLGGNALFAPLSNFAGEGPVEAGSLAGITAFGASDMAGNVREWCSNETRDGAMVRGGAWSDPTYMFNEVSQLPRLDRSPQNGFRCALYPEGQEIPAAALERIDLEPPRDLYAFEPVSDEVFAVFQQRFDYDRTELEVQIEETLDLHPYWRRETVSFDAAYGGERMLAHLFLPRSASPPFQTVIYFPGSGSLVASSSDEIDEYWEVPLFLSHIIKNGRAVLYPVYKGTFERQDLSLLGIHEGDSSYRYTEYLTQLGKDLRRSIDFLETRDDIDSSRLAFYGLSWGSMVGGVLLAVEDRFDTALLLSGGVAVRLTGRDVSFRPESDPMNYLPRIKLPTLMINGRYDMLLPLEHSIQPMFDLLGTSPEDKQLLLYDTDHIPPRTEIIKQTLSWLDRYLGPVE